jgi:8-oxo-dGTP pyrophosphatase MutT (NUDIX family)
MVPDQRPFFRFKQPYKRSGVLILLYPKADKLHTVLIRRVTYNGAHSGQVSLPGGKKEHEDKTIIHTALREAEEEIGIDSTQVDILGKLSPLQIPVSHFEVHPVVGYLSFEPSFKIDPNEVNYIIYSEIDEFLDPSNRIKSVLTVKDELVDVPGFQLNGDFVWGATAMIINEFIDLINEAKNKISINLE